jgi:hypothetical protein
MTAMKLPVIAGIALAILISANPGGAVVVTSLPSGTIMPMPDIYPFCFGPGPQTFGPGITWTSTNASINGGSIFGYTGGYGFDLNGGWDGSLGPMAGLNSGFDYDGVTDTMTFAFSEPVSGVGGFLNYAPSSTPATIAVYDSSLTLIESFTLTFITGETNNTGCFYGFQETSNTISYFTLTDDYIALTDLTIVPIPASLLLFVSGLVGLAIFRRRFTR